MPKSWIVHWAEDGFKSTEIFRHLQYAGCRLKTINEIAPMELHPETSLKELTVHMIDGKLYIIDSGDLERITKMNKGNYSMIEPTQDYRTAEMEIDEYHVNAPLNIAITKVNMIIDQLNKWLASPRHKISKIFPRKQLEAAMLNNIDGVGRVTRHEAFFGARTLAVAYKIEGRKVTRNDAWRSLNSTI